jgi:hypothetical protein
MRLLLSVAIAASMPLAGLLAKPGPDRPDFSGTWVLDVDKSSVTEGPRLTINIVHTETTLIVGRSGRHREVAYDIYLGDTPARARWHRDRHNRPGSSDMMFRTWWDGPNLITHIAALDGTLVSTETRYMEGPQMVVTETGPGDRRVISYWTKRAEIDYWKHR